MAAADRFNRLAWGGVDGRPKGVIAAGLENGELVLWDPAKIIAGAECVFLSVALNVGMLADRIELFSTSESLILRNTTHTGPVRGLDFNPIQTHLLASGGVSGEVRISTLNVALDYLTHSFSIS